MKRIVIVAVALLLGGCATTHQVARDLTVVAESQKSQQPMPFAGAQVRKRRAVYPAIERSQQAQDQPGFGRF